jgi:hypothetical protein
MTTKMRVESTAETSCISNTSQTMDNVKQNVRTMTQPLSQSFRESLDST